MTFGKSGQGKFGYIVILGILIAMIVLATIQLSQTGGEGFPADPSSVAKWYSKIISGEGLPEDNKALTIIFSIFIPFLASFSMLWALLLLLPVFQSYNTRNAAAVLAFGMSLYALPMMSFIFAAFLPWGLALAGIMIVVGIIIISMRFAAEPALELAAKTGELATEAREAWQRYREAGPPEPVAGEVEVDPAHDAVLNDLIEEAENL